MDKLYEEIAFIAYYFHWPHEEILALEHGQRARYCSEISKINKKINGDENKKNIFDVSF